MHTLVKRHVIYVWIAMLGVLFSALAPAISHAMVTAQAGTEVQVCTMEGMKTIALAGTPSDQPVSTDHFFKHCPFCATHGSTASVLPTAPFVFALTGASASCPPLFHRAATPLFSSAAAKPRGPPGPV